MAPTTAYPLVSIKYCAKCKWQNRAVWYMQEILQTFSDGLVNCVSLLPIVDQPGTFEIALQLERDTAPRILYKRRFRKPELAVQYGDPDGSQSAPYYYDGFIDAKDLKILIRDSLGGPRVGLGHIEAYGSVTEPSPPCTDCK